MRNMDVVIYIRVSSDRQVKGTSLESQEAECRGWCQRNGYNVAKVFIEKGESAKTADRPEFLLLIDYCKKYKPAICLVWKFERWARNAHEHAIYSHAIAKGGTKLMSATEPTENNPAGRLLETIISGVSQFDNEVRAERAKMAMRTVAKHGGWVKRPPFGFRKARSGTLPILIHHPEGAPVVIDLFEGIATGRRNVVQTIAIAAEHRISGNACREMLKNPVYAGFFRDSLTDQREVTAAFPGIINRSTWNTVQDILSGKRITMGKRLIEREEFPLRAQMLCSICGGPITACWSTGHGGKYGYYYCRKGHVRSRVETVHQAWQDLLIANSAEFIPVLQQIRTTAREVIVERMKAVSQVVKMTSESLPRLIDQRARLLDAYLEGTISKEVFTTRDADLSSRQHAAQEAATKANTWAIDVDDCISRTVKLFEDPAALWARLPLRDRRRFCNALYEGKLELTPSGVVEPPFGSGLIGVLRDISSPNLSMARLTGSLQNLQNALKPILDLAA